MPSSYHPGEIVLLAFPFAAGSEVKRRPALVLLDTGNDDIVLARVTSQSALTQFDVQLDDWRQAGLLLPSVVRLHKIATLEKNLVDRKLGVLTANDWTRVRSVLLRLWTGL